LPQLKRGYKEKGRGDGPQQLWKQTN